MDDRYVTKGEMDAHLLRFTELMVSVDSRLKNVEDAVGANARWVSARITKTVDTLLPIAITGLIVWLISQGVGG